jgi:hypothetical protein
VEVGVMCVDILKSSVVVVVPDGVGASKVIGPSGLNLLTQQVDSEGEGFRDLSLNQEVMGRAAEDPTNFVKVSNNGDPLVVDGSNLKKGKEVFLPAHIEISEDSISNNTLENNSEAHSSHCSDESHNSLHEVALGVTPNNANFKKQVPRVKFPQGCGPKFLKLVEAVKECGSSGRRRRQRGGEELGRARSVPASQRGRLSSSAAAQADVEAIPILFADGETSTTVTNLHLEGLNLEVVLPGPVVMPSAAMISPYIGDSQEIQETPLIQQGIEGQKRREAEKILEIQKQVGFSFTLNDDKVLNVLIEEETKDRAVKRVREQSNGDQ